MIVAGIFLIVGAWIGGAIGFLCGYKFAIGELKQKDKKMITEDYVSFEAAKLLKDKGFECATHYYYDKDGDLLFSAWSIGAGKNECSAPTLQMAMKWLREVHNIHIAVIVAYHHIPRRYETHIMKLENIDDFILHPQVDFDSYEEACEAAIKYCLENLI